MSTRPEAYWQPPRFFDPAWIGEKLADYAAERRRVARVVRRRLERRLPWLDTRRPAGERSAVAEALCTARAAWHDGVFPLALLLLRALSWIARQCVPLPLLAACAGAAAIFNFTVVATAVADHMTYERSTLFYLKEVMGNTELSIMGPVSLTLAGFAGLLLMAATVMTLHSRVAPLFLVQSRGAVGAPLLRVCILL